MDRGELGRDGAVVAAGADEGVNEPPPKPPKLLGTVGTVSVAQASLKLLLTAAAMPASVPFTKLTTKSLWLLLLASPVLAEPPVVLSVTTASPVVAFWLLPSFSLLELLLILTVLEFATFVVVSVEVLILLSDCGPVLLMVFVAATGAGAAAQTQACIESLLSTFTVAFVALLLLASPVVAEPALVLPEAVAEPLSAD